MMHVLYIPQLAKSMSRDAKAMLNCEEIKSILLSVVESFMLG